MLFYHQHQCNQCYLLSYPGIHIAIEFINLIYLFISLALLPKVTYQSAKSDTSLLYSPCKHAASENSIKELPKSRITSLIHDPSLAMIYNSLEEI